MLSGRFYVGQNIAWTSLYDWKFTLEAWHEEHKHFRYGVGATRAGQLIGHYTQVTSGRHPHTANRRHRHIALVARLR